MATKRKGIAVTERGDFFGCDSVNDIQSCLNCEKEKCNNCLLYRHERRKYERKKGRGEDGYECKT